jgi:SAM-dependent methyltransferase
LNAIVAVRDDRRFRNAWLRSLAWLSEHLRFFALQALSEMARLEDFAADPTRAGQFDQVLLLDVIEHIHDDAMALRQLHKLMAPDGFIYVTTPDRDWQELVHGPRVTRYEDGWHVRNGYTFEQLETLLAQNGFEPVDRLRFGKLGSAAVMHIREKIFRSRSDALTILLFPKRSPGRSRRQSAATPSSYWRASVLRPVDEMARRAVALMPHEVRAGLPFRAEP